MNVILEWRTFLHRVSSVKNRHNIHHEHTMLLLTCLYSHQANTGSGWIAARLRTSGRTRRRSCVSMSQRHFVDNRPRHKRQFFSRLLVYNGTACILPGVDRHLLINVCLCVTQSSDHVSERTSYRPIT